MSTEKSKKPRPSEVTRLLQNWRGGDDAALDKLMPLVYSELRQLATSYLRKERAGHTLQPTALVHEVYVRLLGDASVEVKDKAHFFTLAARSMRRILVDHARRQRAEKRPAQKDRVALEDSPEPSAEADVDVLALHEALELLHEIEPRQAKLVELRYFGGLTNSEAKEVLGVSLATVERDWKVARLWLQRRLEAT